MHLTHSISSTAKCSPPHGSIGNRTLRPEQEIFGCYTVADSWTFVYGIVNEIETEKPKFAVELSKTYNGLWEIERIVQILKSIVGRYYQ